MSWDFIEPYTLHNMTQAMLTKDFFVKRWNTAFALGGIGELGRKEKEKSFAESDKRS